MSYSPTIGRFLERDPIGYDDGMNPYEFVGSNPIAYVDPLGTQRWYQGWGTTIYAAFGGYGSNAAGQVWNGAAQGAQGGTSIVTNTMTFGGSDAVGLTQSN